MSVTTKKHSDKAFHDYFINQNIHSVTKLNNLNNCIESVVLYYFEGIEIKYLVTSIIKITFVGWLFFTS